MSRVRISAQYILRALARGLVRGHCMTDISIRNMWWSGRNCANVLPSLGAATDARVIRCEQRCKCVIYVCNDVILVLLRS